MSDETSGEEVEHELVLPFIACKSAGGKYDDASFTAGFAMGQAYSEGRFGGIADRYYQADLIPQLDLIAMLSEQVMRVTYSDEWPEWAYVEFTPPGRGLDAL